MASTAIMWGANLVNLALNLVLVPRYGALGSAWATVGARLGLALVTMFWIRRLHDAERLGAHVDTHGPSYRELLSVGAAAALSQAAEAGAFSGMTMLAGRLGESAVAGYQIVLNFTAVVFMVSLGVASATAVLTSEAEGRRAHGDAARAGFMGLALNTGLMLGITLLVGAVSGLASPCVHRRLRACARADRALPARFPRTHPRRSSDGRRLCPACTQRQLVPHGEPPARLCHRHACARIWLAERLSYDVLGLVWAVLLSSVLSASVLCWRLIQLARRSRAKAA